MEDVRYRFVSLRALLSSVTGVHSNGPLDRVKEMPVSDLRCSLPGLWLGRLLLQLLLRLHKRHAEILEELD